MDTRLCFVLLLLIVVSAKRKSEPEDALCRVCKGFAELVKESTDTSTGKVAVYLAALKSICARIPSPELEKRCKTLLKQCKTLISTASGQTEGLCSQVCPEFIQTQLQVDSVINEGTQSAKEVIPSNTQFCRYCKVLFRLLWARLNIDDFIDRARQKVMRFCVQAQVVSKKDCKKAVDEAVSQMEIPDAESVCVEAKFCEDRPSLPTTPGDRDFSADEIHV